jgi:hypothetical protein
LGNTHCQPCGFCHLSLISLSHKQRRDRHCNDSIFSRIIALSLGREDLKIVFCSWGCSSALARLRHFRLSTLARLLKADQGLSQRRTQLEIEKRSSRVSMFCLKLGFNCFHCYESQGRGRLAVQAARNPSLDFIDNL